MLKVKYLKDLCSGVAGSVQDLQEYEANVLIQLGMAEIFDEKAAAKKAENDRLAAENAKAKRLADEKEYEQIPPNILLNLNGRPVVGDYGDMIQQPETLSVVEEPKKKGSKASK
ncbi:hypothetical protein [Acinetobacter johnsonii]|uniref:hypothetical protein n=1 Tax=Acinetobacter johnsonii TaxID=40214 RepID=UPI00301A1478